MKIYGKYPIFQQRVYRDLTFKISLTPQEIGKSPPLFSTGAYPQVSYSTVLRLYNKFGYRERLAFLFSVFIAQRRK